ncbi:diaminopimelate epimerase [Sphingomonas bacterium]|uniref:diaminopimelate epimerase n=1 Tax=Sphingomonas bacterium TaxID=1895847 RepID=UPI001575E544|nr:diaminopimelate epimerase [Sphingomonas bacterium]
MRIPVVKCHGSGNDFPLVDARAVQLSDAEWATVARALADRTGPVGGDGLLLLGPGDQSVPFSMAMYNSDGSEAETCLNGLRCVARAGFAALGIEVATVGLMNSTAEASHAADLAPGVYTVRETAGPATHDVADWPMTIGRESNIETAIAPLGSARAFTAVAIPNPHLIAFVEAVDEAELATIGRVCEAAPGWLPNRANVSFVELRDPATLFVRTFERGVGLTDSCGSAMAASVHAAGLTGRIAFGTPVVVLNRGGLVRAVAAADGMVTIEGNATWQWTGSIDVDPATGAVRDLRIDTVFHDEAAAWAAATAA